MENKKNTYGCPQKNFSPIGPAAWPAIGNIYIYECLVLLYRLIMLRNHKEEQIACDQCDKTFRYAYDLKTHMMLYHDCILLSCDFCSKQYLLQQVLTAHVQEEHSQQKRYLIFSLIKSNLKHLFSLLKELKE